MGDKKNYSFEDLNNIFSLYDDFVKFNESCIEFVDKVNEENFKNYLKIKEKQGSLLKFNVFDILSDKWYRENFHSDILYIILKENKEVLKCFLEAVGADHSNYEDYSVEKEKGRVDLAIIGKKHAIAIENKINWAVDQPEQLFRYYTYLKDTRNLEVEKIVYLVPKAGKKPSENSLGYESAERDAQKKAEKIDKLVGNPLVGFDGSDTDLVSLLQKSLNKLTITTDNDENYKMILRNYIDLLKYTGAGDMSVVASEFLKEIKNSPEALKKAYFIKEMMDNLPSARIQFFIETLGFGNNWENKAWFFDYKKKDVSYFIDIEVTNKYKTKILVSNRHENDYTSETYKLFQSDLKLALENISIKWEVNEIGRYVCEFPFPDNDEEVIEVTKQIHDILSNWEK